MRELRPYQRLMIEHLVTTPKAGLWAAMGLGKTAAVLHAIDALLLAGSIDSPVLVIAPLRVARDVWPQEAKEWPDLKTMSVVPIVGSIGQRRNALHTPAAVYTINYENLEWLVTTWNVHWPYKMLVLDESTKVKSLRANIRKNNDGTQWIQGQGGKRAKALLKVVFDHQIQRIVELSGTPAPNGLSDLWGQLFYLDFGKRLGRVYDAFHTRWFRSSFNGWGSEPLPHAQEQIQDALKDICLSMKSEDYFPVEKPIVRTIEVELPPEVRKKYRELEKTMFTEIQEHPIEAFSAGARTMKLLQLAAGATYLGSPDDPGERKWVVAHDEKLNALEDVIEEAAGAPILVAYQFKSDLARLIKRFPHGKPLDQKPQTLAEWNLGKIPLLFFHPASAGHGLNLQHGGNRIVFFTSGWNLEEHLQAIERIGPVRQMQSGYNRNVFVYQIVARGTVDEDVQEVLSTKRTVQDALMDGLRRRLHNNA
jgi:SNF2 family DNA or RNA helicase